MPRANSRPPRSVFPIVGVLLTLLLGFAVLGPDTGQSTRESCVTAPVPASGPAAAATETCRPVSDPVTVTQVFFWGVAILLLLAIAYAVIRAVRTPPGFVRLAEGLTTWALAVFGFGIVAMLVVLAIGVEGTEFSAGNVTFSQSSVTVSGKLSSEFGSSGTSSQAYERRLARRSFGPGATITESGDRGFSVQIKDPSTGTLLLAILSALWYFATILGCLYALRTVLASALRGDPFGERPVRWMRWLAFGLLLAGPGGAIVRHLTTAGIVHELGGSAFGLAWNIPGLVILGAILVFALSELWRYANHLQREVEATV